MSDFNEICIVMEYIETDLNHILRNKTHISEQNLLKIIYTALCSICFFHQANVIHRDMKTSNILIGKDFTAKVCDFGLSRTLP